MTALTKGLIVLAVIAFATAVVVKLFTRDFIGVQAEGYSRACSNLALIAIALGIAWKPQKSEE